MVELRTDLTAVCESLAEIKKQLQGVSSPNTKTESSQQKTVKFKKKLQEIYSKQVPQSLISYRWRKYRAMNCQLLFDAIEHQQSDELKLLQTAEGRISELHCTNTTLREENTSYRLQLREFEFLKSSFQQQKS